ncbi:MAG: carboxylesterase family protein [Baekduiaceae bacterium]
MGRRTGRTALARWVCAAALVVALGACEVPPPEGPYPLRYRDMTFSVQTTPDLQYGQAPGPGGTPQKLLLDVYAPAGDTAAKRPAVIWMHGGSFKYGSRKDSMTVELAQRFARRGYVAVSISYRLLAEEACGGSASTERCMPAALAAADDERAAIRYLRSRAAELRIDPDRIAIGGISAGGVASVLAGATADTPGTSGNPGPSSAARAVVSISGGLPTNLVFTAGDPPTLFWHGMEDTVVPFEWAHSNARYMMQNGLIGVLRYVEGAGHVPGAQFDDMDAQARNFLYKMLSLAGAVTE